MLMDTGVFQYEKCDPAMGAAVACLYDAAETAV
jgi:hypothetical protein